MIELLANDLYLGIVIGMSIGYGCPKCATAILGRGKCDDCPENECDYCPESCGGNN